MSTAQLKSAAREGAVRRYVRGVFAVTMALSALAATSETETIRVGALSDWPPYFQLDAKNEPDGFAIAIFNSVARRTDLQWEYRLYPTYYEMLRGIETGEIDVIANIGALDTRKPDLLFTRPVSTFAVTAFVRRASVDITSLEDVTGPIAVVTTNSGIDLMKDKNTNEYDTVGAALIALLANEVDALVYPEPIVTNLAKRANLDQQIRQLEPGLLEVSRAIGVSRNRKDLRDQLDLAVEELLESGEFGELYSRWYAAAPVFWNSTRIIAVGLALLAIIVAGFWIVQARTRRRYQRDLRTQAQLLEVIDGVLMRLGPDNRITYANQATKRLIGYEPDELIGQNPFNTMMDLSSIETADFALQSLHGGTGWTEELNLQHRDGTLVPAQVTAAPLYDKGRINGITLFATDLTSLKKMESKLHQSSRLEVIGRLTGGISHDFNNMMTIIKGDLELAIGETDEGSTVMPSLVGISNTVTRATALTQELLAFGRPQPILETTVNPVYVARGIEQMLGRILGDKISLTIKNEGSAGLVKIDPSYLERVLMNLTTNAADAIADDQGKVDIIIRNIVDSPPTSRDWVQITVSDDGPGIPDQSIGKVFEPFFTTKPLGRGTGLGLALVQDFVAKSGGEVSVTSGKGGTTVVVRFPRVYSSMQSNQEMFSREPGKGGDEVIMVVDDNDAVRNMIVRTLKKAGYKTIDAGLAVDALRLIQDGQHFDLLMTDYMMPDMNGSELAKQIAQTLPTVLILYMTGYSNASLPINDTDRRLLTKPFDPTQLLSMIREMLDQRAAL